MILRGTLGLRKHLILLKCTKPPTCITMVNTAIMEIECSSLLLFFCIFRADLSYHIQRVKVNSKHVSTSSTLINVFKIYFLKLNFKINAFMHWILHTHTKILKCSNHPTHTAKFLSSHLHQCTL